MGEKTVAEFYCAELSTAVESSAACTVESIAFAASLATLAAESVAACIAVLSTVVPEESEPLEQATIHAVNPITSNTVFILKDLFFTEENTNRHSFEIKGLTQLVFEIIAIRSFDIIRIVTEKRKRGHMRR